MKYTNEDYATYQKYLASEDDNSRIVYAPHTVVFGLASLLGDSVSLQAGIAHYETKPAVATWKAALVGDGFLAYIEAERELATWHADADSLGNAPASRVSGWVRHVSQIQSIEVSEQTAYEGYGAPKIEVDAFRCVRFSDVELRVPFGDVLGGSDREHTDQFYVAIRDAWMASSSR